jgi:DNA polymerase (family X)
VTLAQLASLAMIRGDQAEASVFDRAAALARSRHIDSDAETGPLLADPPPDADPEVLKRLRHMYEAGGWVLVESALADLPSDLRWLYESGAVTIDQLDAIHRSLGATSAADLAWAISERRIRALPGLSAEVEAAIAAALPTLRATIPRVPLGRAVTTAEPVLEKLRTVPGVQWAMPVGSLRRGQDTVGDIEIVAATTQPADAIAEVLRDPEFTRVLHNTAERLYLLTDRVQIGVRLPQPENAGATLLYLTGPAAHFEALQAHAAGRGFRLTAEGLQGPDGALQPAADEEAIYGALGLPFIPPEIREGAAEIAAAGRSELPRLVTVDDIRGDLHMHTLWSDGRDATEAMVKACIALGYEYLAITDHSQSSAAIRNLTAEGVKKQADEIAALREKYPQIAILHGCEVDILPDGRLDFNDRILERFDIVLASLHESAAQPPDQLMKRYLSAMRHPLVSVITHPSNRLVPHRRGYDLDYDRLFALALEHQTALEIDGAPSHLDLDGALARRAVAAGATVVIDGDCHRAETLGLQMRLGIITARRGWVEPRHVLNARPIDEVRAFIAAKRGAR